MNLLLKIFYTLKEASVVLNERLKSTEIDEDYFLHLGMRGDICLGVFAKPNFENTDCGVLYSDWFEFDELKALENLKAINTTMLTLNEVGSILILNNGTIKDMYFNKVVQLEDAYFDNAYSIESQEFAVKGDLEENFSCCQYFDKLETLDFYDVVFYSNKQNVIHNEEMRSKYLSLPENEADDDWKVAYWFNSGFDRSQDMEDFQSEREICRDDILILGEDIELLLNGKKREPVVIHPRKRSNKTNHSELDLKLHPKRENSINKIILALSNKAGLDLSSHMTAYEKLNVFAQCNGLSLPNKDTCGKLFKNAFESKDSN